MLLELAKSENILNAFQQYDLAGIEPFQLLVYFREKLFRLLWDGFNKHEIHLQIEENHLLSSRTLYDDNIISERDDFFKKFQETEKITSENILKFHKTHRIEMEQNIQTVIKERFVTVSITQLIIKKIL